MYQISRNIIKDDMRAEEAMQDAFLQAFENLHEFSQEVTFGAWLRKIVINKSLDYLKSDKMYTQSETVDKIEFTDELEDIEIKHNVDAVKEAMNKLPENFRILLSLYYLEGYDHEEISEILDISYANSRTMLNRAKNKLISLLN